MQDPWKQLAIIGPLVLIAYGYHIYTFWRKRYRPSLPENRRENSYRPPKQRRALGWIIGLSAAALGITWGVLGIRGNSKAIALDQSMSAIARWVWPVAILCLAALFILAWLAQRDPQLAEIIKRQRDDNADDLLREVQALLDFKRTENRHVVKSALLLSLKRYDEAMESIDSAEAIRKKPGKHDATRALILFQSGQQEKGLELLAAVSKRFPEDFVQATNHCTCLADAGRHDEALAQLDRAEYLFKKFNAPKVWAPLLKECRDKCGISSGFEVIAKPGGVN